MKKLKTKGKKRQYLTVHMRPSKTLKHTVQVSVPMAYYEDADLGEMVKTAIQTVQARMQRIMDEGHH